MAATILHIDMDAFFASVEQRDNPSLRGKPVLVGGGRGGTGKRGVVTTASYEARTFGCRSAMPMAQARRLCPQAIIVPARMGAYSAVSRQMMAVLDEFSPDAQKLGIDEAFLDVTNVQHLHGDGPAIAAKIKQRVRTVANLPCTVGVAPNKFLAKLASDLGKPDGLFVITPETIDTILPPLPVKVLYTVGPKAAAALETLGIRTIADLRRADAGMLKARFGDHATLWIDLAHGRDSRTVHAQAAAKSIGQERTFSDDLTDPDRLRAVLLGQVEEVSRQLRGDRLHARRVVVKMRTGDFKTVTRSATLPEPTDRTDLLWSTARDLFESRWRERPAPLRLLGVALSDFSGEVQSGLFDEVSTAPAQPSPSITRRARLDATADAINAKFGHDALSRARTLATGLRRRESHRD
jgi:DNA polymerase IV